MTTEIRLGAGPFAFPIGSEHPFYRAVRVHDEQYTELIEKRSTKTLAQIDREFLRNMLRMAMSQPGLAEKVKWSRRAWVFYRLARAWAKLVRYGLDDYLEER